MQSCNISNDPLTVYSCLAKESANFTNLMSATSNFDWAQDQCQASFDMLGKIFLRKWTKMAEEFSHNHKSVKFQQMASQKSSKYALVRY